MTADELRLMRKRSRHTRQKLADLLGYSANYIYLLESGRKPITAEIDRRIRHLTGLDVPNTVVHEDPAPYGCRIPADCDLPGQLEAMRSEIQDLKGKMDTLLGLLGGPLRRAAGIEDGKDQRPAV
jgi:transcriptional regulator with XRE-family HTH domain